MIYLQRYSAELTREKRSYVYTAKEWERENREKKKKTIKEQNGTEKKKEN